MASTVEACRELLTKLSSIEDQSPLDPELLNEIDLQTQYRLAEKDGVARVSVADVRIALSEFIANYKGSFSADAARQNAESPVNAAFAPEERVAEVAFRLGQSVVSARAGAHEALAKVRAGEPLESKIYGKTLEAHLASGVEKGVFTQEQANEAKLAGQKVLAKRALEKVQAGDYLSLSPALQQQLDFGVEHGVFTRTQANAAIRNGQEVQVKAARKHDKQVALANLEQARAGDDLDDVAPRSRQGSRPSGARYKRPPESPPPATTSLRQRLASAVERKLLTQTSVDTAIREGAIKNATAALNYVRSGSYLNVVKNGKSLKEHLNWGVQHGVFSQDTADKAIKSGRQNGSDRPMLGPPK